MTSQTSQKTYLIKRVTSNTVSHSSNAEWHWETRPQKVAYIYSLHQAGVTIIREFLLTLYMAPKEYSSTKNVEKCLISKMYSSIILLDEHTDYVFPRRTGKTKACCRRYWGGNRERSTQDHLDLIQFKISNEERFWHTWICNETKRWKQKKTVWYPSVINHLAVTHTHT